LIRLLFPDAVVIHCNRDAVATCWSLYTAHFGLHAPYYNSLESLSHFYRSYRRLMKHWRHSLTPGIIEVQYEGLALDPETSIRALVSACGLKWENACLTFNESPLPAFTASMQQVRQPIHSESITRWRKFEKYLGPLISGLSA
jgi:hypothetical protein